MSKANPILNGRGVSRPTSSMDRQRTRALLLFLVPGMSYLVLVRIMPALFTVYLSFTDWNLKEGRPPTFVGLRNYIELAHDNAFLTSIGRTIVFTVAATTIELVLGLAIALFISRDIRAKNFTRAALLTPMVITPAVVGLMWYILFHNEIGPLNWFLSVFGFSPVTWLTDPELALMSIVITDVWHWTPFMFLLCLSAIQMIPTELYESAEVDGASSWQQLTEITLPLIKDTILVAVVLRSMEAFEIFAEPFVMTGGGPGTATETISLHIYKAAFLFFDMGRAGAMIVVSIALLALVYSVYLRFVRFD